MKKLLLFLLTFSSAKLIAQVQFDKQIQLTGNGSDAKVTGIQAISAGTDAASKIYVDTSITARTYWSLSGSNIYKNNTGNVGIGISSPLFPLHLYNTSSSAEMRLESPNTGASENTSAISFAQSTTNAWIQAKRTSGWGTRANNLEFTYYDGTYRDNLVIQPGGNVGIGTTNPLLKLHVMGEIRLDSPNRDKIWFDGNTGTDPHTILDNSGKGIRFYSNGGAGTMMHMNPVNGNVGIGVPSPNYKLEVAGTVKFQNALGWGNGLYIYDGGFRLQKVTADLAAITYPNTASGALIFDVDGVGEKARITTAGNVGINCTSPNYRLHVVGDIAAQGGTIRASVASISTSISACSDIRYKKNILQLKDVLENVLKLNGVYYNWKKDEFPEKYFNDKKQVGFIAQEMEKIYPEVVVTEADGYKSIDYSKLTPILVEAIKEQQKIIEDLKKEINTRLVKLEQKNELKAER